MIILEGPDNAGKTTLAKKLASFLHMKVLHSGGPCIQSEMTSRMTSILESRNTIWDRVPCISEPVYGPIIRNADIFMGTTWLDQLLVRDPFIIYCRTPTYIMIRGHEFKPHEDEEHIREVKLNALKLIHAYDQMMGGIEHMRYDWTSITYHHHVLFMAYCKLIQRRQ